MRWPDAPRYRIRDVRIPAGLLADTPVEATEQRLCDVELTIDDGKIESIEMIRSPDGPPSDEGADRHERDGTPGPSVNGRGGILLPAFVDVHAHIDKAQIWARSANPDGTFAGAMAASWRDQTTHWTVEDVRRRMDFTLRCAFAHGTRTLRTHLDSFPEMLSVVWAAFDQVRDAWRDRMSLQAVSLMSIERLEDAAYFDRVVDEVAARGGQLGGVAYGPETSPILIRKLLSTAAARDLDVDLHVDENLDPASDALTAIAAAALEVGFAGRLTVGHCCSLAVRPSADVSRTLDRVAQAGIAVVSLPLCNLYLQGRRAGRTPSARGVTLVHEMRERGIAVAFGSDNTRDPFYPYGDQDMLEVLREATRIAHLDHPVADWPAAVTRAPADIMRRPHAGRIVGGAPADLVLFNARTYSELFARPQSDRVVVYAGRRSEESLPDYRELDDLIRA